MKINEHIVRIVGDAYVPEGLAMDKSYQGLFQADVKKIAHSSNEDGSENIVYSLKLLTLQIVDEAGKAQKMKDKRSWSKKVRGAIYHLWEDRGGEDTGFNEEAFYDAFQAKFLRHFDSIAEYMRNIKE